MSKALNAFFSTAGISRSVTEHVHLFSVTHTASKRSTRTPMESLPTWNCDSTQVARSEPELRGELHDPWIESRRDRSEAAGPSCAAGAPKFTVFSRLKTSRSQLDRARTTDPDATHHGEIDVAVRRPPHRIAGGGSDRELIGRRERGRVEPAITCPLVSGQCRIADKIRALGREAGVPERVSPASRRPAPRTAWS